MIYAFWNNKGGTGKTSLAFQTICRYAEVHSNENILAIDLCPQANLSELFLGGLQGEGSSNLDKLYKPTERISIGGYFQSRLPAPYETPNINPDNYTCKPNDFNSKIASNVDLVAGDRIVELQTNAMASLSNNQIPGVDTWLEVIDWLKDFIDSTGKKYQTIFIDTNPSFSMYTQIALSVSDRLIIPVMADDSSRRAIRNVFNLVHGLQIPSSIYDQSSFSRKLKNAGRSLPQVHLIIKNRITQFMGAASAYRIVLSSIDDDIENVKKAEPLIFTFTNLSQGTCEVRDFHTAGTVAFALGRPFYQLNAGRHYIMGEETQVKQEYADNCKAEIDRVASML